MEKEKAGAAAEGKKEKRTQEKILDILRDWGKVPGLFLRPMIKQLFNYRAETGENTPKQSQGRMVRGNTLKHNTGRYRRDKAIDNEISKDNRPGKSIQHQHFQ